MRWKIVAIPMVVLAFLGCEEFNTSDAKMPDTKNPDATSPDNSAVNERDRAGDLKTPLDQGQNTADVERTATIRQKILAIEDISVSAQNVKVITENGRVTLRGPVASETEKEAVFQAAVEVAGAENVMNELEVIPSKADPAPSNPE
jgi:hyperosmotically inducible periplasmic protein